jgi:rRNA maturation RNase YbeY
MISFNYECDFNIVNEDEFFVWIENVINSENKSLGEISYIFCDDEYLLEINKQYLNHDYYTDIISFDYTENEFVSGDIFISIDRVKENASDYGVSFDNELKRVIIHGILHFCGYKDKSQEEERMMRLKEEEKINLFHVKQ